MLERFLKSILTGKLDFDSISDLRTFCQRYIPKTWRLVLAMEPLFFIMYYLGITIPEHQRRWIGLYDHQFLVKLAPREHGKTWTFVTFYILYRIYRNYIENSFTGTTNRILLVEKTSKQAADECRRIKNIIETNEYLLEDFGSLVGEKWYDNRFACKRTKGFIERELTLESCGLLGSITGGHFEDIVCDDLLDDENCRTSYRLALIHGWLMGTLWNLRTPKTRFKVLGTRKRAKDTYGDLLVNPIWFSSVEKAIVKYPSNYKYVEENGKIVGVEVFSNDYEVLWKEEWPIKTLLLDRAAQGKLYFDREKQNEVGAIGGNLFRSEWLHFFTDDDLSQDSDGDWLYKGDKLWVVQGVDVACVPEEMIKHIERIGGTSNPDFFVICTLGISSRHYRILILDIYRERIDFPAQMRAIESSARLWKPKKISIESTGYQRVLAQNLLNTTFLNVVESPSKGSKDDRLYATSPHFESGRVLLRGSLDRATGRIEPRDGGIKEFVNEFLEFNFGKHDDCLDAFEIGLREAIGYIEIARTGQPVFIRRPGAVEKRGSQFDVFPSRF